jgi:hypothetical protein
MADLGHLIREVSSLSLASQAAATSGRGSIPDTGAGATSLGVGVRVLDLVTGETGVIVDVSRSQVLIPAT